MDSPQTHTLKLFTALWFTRAVWPGTLLLGIGLGETGRALARASLAVGAAGLFLEADPAALRTAQREGCCTFSVSTLEEAVRVLKNEVRQGRAITVAVRGDAAVTLHEMLRRGIQPDVTASERPLLQSEQEPCSAMVERGSMALHGLGLPVFAPGQDLADVLFRELGSGWQVREELATTMAERRQQDQNRHGTLGSAATEDPLSEVAGRWLRVAPSLFPRALDRAYLSNSPEG